MRHAATFEFWAMFLLFLGSCRKYEQALEYHRQALVLIPQHASTYSAIGYVHSLMGDFESAIDYFHTVFCLAPFFLLKRVWIKDTICVQVLPLNFNVISSLSFEIDWILWFISFFSFFFYTGSWTEKGWHFFRNHAWPLYWDVHWWHWRLYR